MDIEEVFRWFPPKAHEPASADPVRVGFLLGVGSLVAGVKGGNRNENLGLIGTLICATSLAIVLTLNQVLRYVQWDTFPWMW